MRRVFLASALLLALGAGCPPIRLEQGVWQPVFNEIVRKDLDERVKHKRFFPLIQAVPTKDASGTEALLGTIIRDTKEVRQELQAGNWTQSLSVEGGSPAVVPTSFRPGRSERRFVLSEDMSQDNVGAAVAAQLVGFSASASKGHAKSVAAVLSYDSLGFLDIPGGESQLFNDGRPKWRENTKAEFLKDGAKFLIVTELYGANALEISYARYSQDNADLLLTAKVAPDSILSATHQKSTWNDYGLNWVWGLEQPHALAIGVRSATVKRMGEGLAVILAPYDATQEDINRVHAAFRMQLLESGTAMLPVSPGISTHFPGVAADGQPNPYLDYTAILILPK